MVDANPPMSSPITQSVDSDAVERVAVADALAVVQRAFRAGYSCREEDEVRVKLGAQAPGWEAHWGEHLQVHPALASLPQPAERAQIDQVLRAIILAIENNDDCEAVAIAETALSTPPPAVDSGAPTVQSTEGLRQALTGLAVRPSKGDSEWTVTATFSDHRAAHALHDRITALAQSTASAASGGEQGVGSRGEGAADNVRRSVDQALAATGGANGGFMASVVPGLPAAPAGDAHHD